MAIIALKWFLIASVLVVLSYADSKSNPADELVVVLNSNRTAHNLTSLSDNPGLGCIALQYIKAYEGHCDKVSGPNAEKPVDSDFAQAFAPNCGVDVKTLGILTGRLIGCQTKYIHAPEAFSELLVKDARGLSIVYNKSHTELGAGVSGSDGGSPYFWCILFSNGKPASSFVLLDGTAKIQRPGCYSGTNDSCSHAEPSIRTTFGSGIVSGLFLALGSATILFIL